MTETAPPIYPLPVEHLRNAANRLAAELDDARLFQAAAYASMAADAIDEGPAHAPTVEIPRTDVECEFEVDEHDRIWLIRRGDCLIIGKTSSVFPEMFRLISAVVLGHEPK
jgi:hypothetical protein